MTTEKAPKVISSQDIRNGVDGLKLQMIGMTVAYHMLPRWQDKMLFQLYVQSANIIAPAMALITQCTGIARNKISEARSRLVEAGLIDYNRDTKYITIRWSFIQDVYANIMNGTFDYDMEIARAEATRPFQWSGLEKADPIRYEDKLMEIPPLSMEARIQMYPPGEDYPLPFDGGESFFGRSPRKIGGVDVYTMDELSVVTKKGRGFTSLNEFINTLGDMTEDEYQRFRGAVKVDGVVLWQ